MVGGGGSGSGSVGSPRETPWDTRSTADTGFFVHVGGLSFSTSFTTLAKRFGAFGDVNGFKVIFNKVSCRAAGDSTAAGGAARRGSREEAASAKAAVVTASAGFAFISFDDERGMEKAVEGMNGQTLDGQVLKVTTKRLDECCRILVSLLRFLHASRMQIAFEVSSAAPLSPGITSSAPLGQYIAVDTAMIQLRAHSFGSVRT